MLPPRQPDSNHNASATLLLTICLLLAACAQVQPREAATDAKSPPVAQNLKEDGADASPESEPRAFPIDTFYTLLVAEVAGIREQYDVALANYYHQAEVTKDAGVAERATRIARFLNARQAALRSAQLWVELEPDNADAQLALTAELTLAGELSEAMVHAEQALKLGGKAPLQSLAATAIGREKLDDQIRAEFARLARAHPNNDEVALAHAMVLRATEQYNQALVVVRRIQESHPDQLDAPLLQSHLLVDLGKRREAIELLEKLVSVHPNETRLRLQYARLLIREDLALARQQFAELVKQRPEDGNLILSLALIQYETNQLDLAKPLLDKLLELEQHESAAHFYLGGLAEKRGEIATAVKHFRQVEPGNDYVEAITKGTKLLATSGKHDENEKWFTKLRQQHPRQEEHFFLMEVELLRKNDEPLKALERVEQGLKVMSGSGRLMYTRALLNDQLGNATAFEHDLRNLLERDPENATVLNALGYKLIDDDARLQEAFELISKALKLEPEDPAIIDSMGWVQYRLGNFSAAEKYLRQAMDKLPDHEIAAHLGEVLWVQGDREGALKIWRDGMKLNPQSKIIPAAMKRLQIKETLEQHASDN
ncbi:tetratricopeptide repeat protein [Microbulbifer sp. MLAF003]|uniref:tetratricopeptide repeat protein n=1 Tax=Microbulbifer sp. MLAF003 TaxID=3032582 RepID=UPI0024ADDDAB|nr:tetratricopeptide repeat protein [Microbulbifer sp. MLAF003]WHI52187.1 tetratricopeptide repeat protein [Microbulbifer sp. MLAF003]